MYGEGRVARPTRFLSGALSERQSCTIGSRVIRRSNCITTAPDTTILQSVASLARTRYAL